MSFSSSFNGSEVTTEYLVDEAAFGIRRGKQIGFMPYGSDVDEELYLAPEKVLLLAKTGSPSFVKDTLVQELPLSIVAFTWRNYPVRLFFNKYSGYLSQVEITRHYTDNTPFLFGDIRKVHQYSYWKTEDKKFHYPAQKDVFIGGLHFQSYSIDSVKLNVAVEETSLSIPDSTKSKLTLYSNRMNMFTNVPVLASKEILPGIFFINGKNTAVGSYNAWFVKTKKGVIVLEAPVSSAYSKGVINEVNKQFPSEKILAVLTTSDARPHIGGLREYVARKIPVYGLELNEPLISRALQANYISNPDSLQKKKAKPVYTKVNGKLALGDEENLIELYPVKTENGERMMMVWFPKHKLLYSSDLVQPGGKEKFFMPQYIGEIIEAINREKLPVEKIIGMHQPLIEYKELLEFMK
ncbi:MAG: MBL fold metallo-hydrolase [Chitinophagaceae bacterium]|nr:MBL fold metallo-hydrolase [Chitinophagaceae bacterium]